MRTLLAALFVFAFAASAYAIDGSPYITIDQPSADSRTFITATVKSGVICSQGPPVVTVSGSKIVIEATWLSHVCLAAGVPPPSTAKIGTLPGGVYEILGKNLAPDGDVVTKLVVRGVDPFRVYPPGGTTAGGTKLELWYEASMNAGLGIAVTVDGVQVQPPVIAAGVEHATFIAPPHPPGDVDIALSFIDTRGVVVATYISRAAYRYYDPADGPEPFLFERLLFPVQSESAGAAGAQWTTDNVIGAGWTAIPGFVEFWKPPCAGCPSRIAAAPDGNPPVTTFAMDKRTTPSGTLLYVFRGLADAVVASSRVREIGTNAKSAGTDIPIVRERDFRRLIQLVSIPTDARNRVMLRVWASKDVGLTTIGAGLTGSKRVDVPLTFTRASVDALPFASADLTPLLRQLSSDPFVQFQVLSGDVTNPVWAMISITNNETQDVTIISPH